MYSKTKQDDVNLEPRRGSCTISSLKNNNVKFKIVVMFYSFNILNYMPLDNCFIESIKIH